VSWGAVILAGGEARRMGGEKPLIEVRGRTLLEHAIDLVRPLVDEVVVSAGTREFELPPGVSAVPDEPELAGQGPLAGVASALAALSAERVLLLPCDLPNMTAALLRALQSELEGVDCVFFDGATGAEPLVAALRREPAHAAARDALAADRRKVVPCWRGMAHKTLDDDWVARFGDPTRTFANVNTPEDLSKLD